MATRFFTRCLLTPSKQTLTSMFSRSFTSLPLGKTPQSLPASSFYLRPLVAIAPCLRHIPVASSVRCFATRQTSSSLNDPNPNWSNRPPKETILLDGCDFEHWLVVMEKPEGEPTRDEIIDSYIKTLAQVVGSEDEARMKIYSVSTKHYFAFGALVSEELSYKLKELSRVRWVLPDSYLDVKNKDYGGEPFINGQAVPYDEKYHAEWVRNNARANERNRRNDRPRNYDRSRNFDRRRDVQMVNQNAGANMGPGGPGGPQNMGPNNTGYLPPNNIGGVPPNNMGGVAPNRGGMPSNNMGGVPSNMGGQQPSNYTGQQPSNYTGQQPSNYTGQQPSNYTGQQPSNYTGQQPSNYTGQQPSNYTGQQPSNYTGQPPSNYTGQQSSNYTGQPPSNYTGQQPSNYTGQQPANYMGGQAGLNYGGMPHNNMGGAPNNAPNSGEAPYQSGPGPNQNNYAPNVAGGNPYHNQNMPGRDIPPAQNYQ